MLESCAQRGAGLVKQILGFVHGSAGTFQSVQARYLARDIIGIIEDTFPKSIRLESQVPADLWPVQGNATQIHQVLLNLCVNARDAMPQGGILRLVAANRRLDPSEAAAMPGGRPGNWLVIEVADTGTGMAPELVEKIWQPFFTTKGLGKGTGLGLSTVRGLVAGHHGFITLQTEVGRGTTFRVFLPALESEEPKPAGAHPTTPVDGQGELVLVVDDNAAVLETVATILRQHGYRVAVCDDGVEAIVYFVTHPGEIAVVITDVDMPRLGGLALARSVLQIQPGIRLLVMSGL
ncbi:MAG: ATP-binding protein, partial [Opitutus sp.]